MPNTTKNKESQAANGNKHLFSDTNLTIKTGHLTKDAEIVGDGNYVKIRIASNKKYEDKSGEIKTNTNYFNALVSKNLTDSFAIAKDLKKGDWVYLEGEDSTKSVDTAKGYKETASTIFAYKVVLRKKKLEKSPTQNSEKSEAPPSEPSAT